eukprot:jgi/Hompol1/2846/HPOL_003037-RA
MAANSIAVDDRASALASLLDHIDEYSFELVETILTISAQPGLFQDFADALIKAVKSPQFKVSHGAMALAAPVVDCIVESSQMPLFHLKTIIPPLLSLLIEKIADTRDKCREAALQAITDCYQSIYRRATLLNMQSHSDSQSSSASSPFATMIAFMDREIRAHCFNSSIARTREQPWVPLLIGLLQDKHEPVRIISRDAVVRIYNAIPNHAMRTDIRKELVEKKIRQSIIDSIIQQLDDDIEESVNSASPSSAVKIGMDKPAELEYKPASVAQATSHIKTQNPPQALSGIWLESILITSQIAHPKDIEGEFTKFSSLFSGKETEENWEKREQALQRLRGIVRGDASHRSEFTVGLRSIIDAIVKTPKLVNALAAGLSNANQSIRMGSVECLRVFVERFGSNGASRQMLERSGCLEQVESSIKRAVEDRTGEVRTIARDCFYFLNAAWPASAQK